MCGLAGFVGREDRGVVERMTACLARRGPDGQGIWSDDALGVHLGHRRLAIVDIAGGAQPMWNEDGAVGVIFNGQIYNHLALRRELIDLGHVFSSHHSDTEVLVHGYEAWGEDLPSRLNGMFAFVIVDRRRRRVFMARDRFGEKPLFYARTATGIAFASELSALALHPGVSSEISPRSLQKLFAHGFLPASNALLEGTNKLRSGSWLTYGIESREIKEYQYWRFAIKPDESLGDAAEGRLIDELRDHLQNAVSRRLMSDVPLGIYLSGGVDSSAVLAFARRAQPTAEIKTFTVGFNEASYDESDYARRVAEHYGATHHCEMLDLDKARDLLPSVLGHLDEPMGDPSIIPTYLVARFTRRHVTVALAGDGGDELFAGYDPFAALQPGKLYSSVVPQPVHRALRFLAERMPRSSRNMSLDYKVRRALLGLSYPQSLWNPVWLSPMSPELINHVFRAPLPVEDLYSEALDLWHASPNLCLTDRTLEFYTNLYLQDGILVKADRAAMMNSLESRAIFLDNDLVDFACKLPSRFKYRNGQRKYILKRALMGIVPDFVLDRPKKGFGIPLQSWLRGIDVSVPSSVPGGINIEHLQALTDHQRAGSADNRLAVWSWLAYRSYLDQRNAV